MSSWPVEMTKEHYMGSTQSLTTRWPLDRPSIREWEEHPSTTLWTICIIFSYTYRVTRLPARCSRDYDNGQCHTNFNIDKKPTIITPSSVFVFALIFTIVHICWLWCLLIPAFCSDSESEKASLMITNDVYFTFP
jgi:hypothetical protein